MKKNSRARQDWRTFISEVETCSPSQVLKVNKEISSAYEITAFVSSLEKRGITPLFIFENVKGSSIPVVTNLLGSRTRVAIALGVPNERLHSEYSRRVSTPIPVRKVKKSAAHFRILEGSQIDISEFPVLTHFKDDPAPYITAGLMVAKDPDTGVTTMGYHRLMVKDKNRFGISFHSRKRMWDYARRCEERGQNLPVTCTMGVHPLLSMASIGVFPNHIDKFEIAGGLFGESLEVIEGINSPNLVPVHAEIVMEGEVLAGVREPEGPFGEFTDYSAFWTTPGASALVILVGWNIEILFMFSIAGIVFAKVLPEEKDEKLFDRIPNRWFNAALFAAFCVFVEILLNWSDYLIWEYVWWHWYNPTLISPDHDVNNLFFR